MQRISRRTFMNSLGACTAQAMLCPRLVLGASPARSGSGKNIVCINLYGGLDGLAAFPYLSGAMADRLANSLRPSLVPQRSSLSPVFGQNGFSNLVAYHPALEPIFALAAERIAVVTGYGILGNPGRSHDTCQVLMSQGSSERGATGDTGGFLARLMDSQDWESFQYWALMTENPSDIHTRKRSPMIVSNVDQFALSPFGWERAVDRDFAQEIRAELSRVSPQNSSREILFAETVRSVEGSVARVQSLIAAQQVGQNQSGDYTDSPLGRALKDAAKIFKAKKNEPELGLSGKDVLVLAGQGGFDTHADQINTEGSDGSLSSLLENLAKNLSVLYRDLDAMGVLDESVVIVYSEFGRTVRQNARIGEMSVGSDHGHASNTFVLGGSIRGGVYGAPPTLGELDDEDYNALKPKVDYRDIFSEVLTWMGISPATVFTDTRYAPQRLGFL